ncbi:Rpn family recombination-promoting nuclease/putative transposase [Orrella dioscoreae]|uniref:Putative transposase n=1 Tax=Orrella dioscoreae TaxID=1851544 RepID=A0A1C3K6F8_9BURK|nr:Rpn family recombination-promoting nuclease/putative transposase [Orrella dioscoreae]SBT26927.1 putative transposase [Orrella dioscoreae]SOE52536.1 putative transposase [Orrella dioscoreae]
MQVSRLTDAMPHHDTHYKQLFSHPRMVMALLRGFVPQAWVAHIDATALTQLPASYLSDRGEQRHSDRVWRIPLRRHPQNATANIHLLLEFQSRPDPHMALRMMSYVSLLLQAHARTSTQNGRLPPVLAVVLYNGQRAWRARTEYRDLADACPPDLQAYQPQLRYLLLDPLQLACTGAAYIDNPVALLFQLEQSRHPNEMTNILADLARCTRSPGDASLRRAFVEWLRNALLPGRFPSLKLSTIDDLEEFRDMLADTVKDWTRQWKREGMQEGRREGKRLGMLEGRREGRKEGRQAGRQEGKHDATRTLLTRQLTCRFGPVPAAIGQRIARASLQDLEQWSLALLDAPDIGSVFAHTRFALEKEKAAEAALPAGTPAS